MQNRAPAITWVYVNILIIIKHTQTQGSTNMYPSDDLRLAESGSDGRLILLSLVLSMFSIISPGPLTGILLIDIGVSFGSSVGVMGQIRILASIVTVFSALVMGVLSVRFRHKSLLLAGLLFVIASALGCGFAPSFNAMLISYSLSGLGLAMVMPMAYTLVGDHLL